MWVQQLGRRVVDAEASRCRERWGLEGVCGGRLGLCRPASCPRLQGRLKSVESVPRAGDGAAAAGS